MARLDFPDYLLHLRAESQRFRDVLADSGPKARVPGCPDWNAGDLLWHLTGVQHFWAWVVANRPNDPETGGYDEPERPASYEELLAAFDEHSAALATQLESADPTDKAWTWSTEQSVGFTFRRQAHEALIHRLDAEQATGQVTALDPALAADGVHEVLDIMYGGCPEWGTFSGLPHYVRIDCTDTGDRVWVQIGRFSGTDPADDVHYAEDDINVVPDPGVEADAVINGDAATILTRLWRRGDGADIHVAGDMAIVDHFRAAVHGPIN